jgi:transposase
MSEVAQKTVKRTAVKKTKAEEVADNLQTTTAETLVQQVTEKASKPLKMSGLKKKVAAEAVQELASSASVADSAAVPATQESKKKGSKVTASNTDAIITLIMDTFKIDSKALTTLLHNSGLLPSKSAFKKLKKHKNKDAPKKARTAYLFFATEQRKSVIEQNQGIKFPDVVKVIAKTWNALSPELKKPYEDLAEADKLRYSRAKEEWNASHPQDAPQESRAKATVDRSTDPSYILNPATGAYVRKNSTIGKGLLSATATTAS